MGIRKRGTSIGSTPTFQTPDAVFVEDGSDVTPWTALNADTTVLVDDVDHVLGSGAISFNKSGTVGTVGGIERSGLALDLSEAGASALLELVMDVPDLTNVASVHVRLGADDTNYAQFEFADSEFTAGDVWDRVTKEIAAQSKANQGLNGLDLTNVEYIAILVNFDLAANTLTDILFDSLVLKAA